MAILSRSMVMLEKNINVIFRSQKELKVYDILASEVNQMLVCPLQMDDHQDLW